MRNSRVELAGTWTGKRMIRGKGRGRPPGGYGGGGSGEPIEFGYGFPFHHGSESGRADTGIVAMLM